MPGPLTVAPPPKLPTWADPALASVFDYPGQGLLRKVVGMLGLDDPQQVMAVGVPLETGAMTGGLLDAVAQKFPRFAKAIKAYHGSPRDFDQFSSAKIGTGEGAAAYGHGLYFAENEATAKAYRAQLAHPPESLVSYERDVAALRARANADPSIEPYARQAETNLARMRTMPGKTYEVAIHADPEKMLDWDKPLSQQSEHVQKALRSEGVSGKQYEVGVIGTGHLGNQNDRYVFDSAVEARKFAQSARAPGSDYEVTVYDATRWKGELTGKDAYRLFENKKAADPGAWANPSQHASEYLKEIHDIPGIKYLDQGSRAAGEGSRNFVVFDDKTIDILKKYGILLPVAGAGAVGAHEATK